MNYGNLIYKEISFGKFFFSRFRKMWVFGNVCLYFWCSLYYKLLFLMRLSDSVSFSVYEHISFHLHFLKNVQKCEYFSYNLFF